MLMQIYNTYLDGFNNLGWTIACQCKARRRSVNIHHAPQRLLRCFSHAAQHMRTHVISDFDYKNMQHTKQTTSTYLSTSSKITILCLPGGNARSVCANTLILLRTVSIPLQINKINDMMKK